MSFYEALQADPAILKVRIRRLDDKGKKNLLYLAMAVRSLLIVIFAIVFISILTSFFGTDNTAMAVALFCFFLAFRFVGYEYNIYDALFSFAFSLVILTFVPSLVHKLSFLPALIVHVLSFFLIIFMTSQNPRMGNGGLYSFAYVYLVGNPVYGEVLSRRFLMALAGFVLCGVLLYIKHAEDNRDVRLVDRFRSFQLASMDSQWTLRFALGVGLALALGQSLGIERFMWMGFASASLLSEYPYSNDISKRSLNRIIGAASGCLLYYILHRMVPASLVSLLGPFGGFLIGFCTDYRYKTAVNCLGALMIAERLYGLAPAIGLRLYNTVLGVVFALVFAWLFHIVANRGAAPDTVC